MSPDFASLVDPIFLHIIDLLERISRNATDSAQTERERIDDRFQHAEAHCGEQAEWQLAKYALVAWIDEQLKSQPWPGSSWWIENSLEFACFKTNDAAVEFFVKGKEAAQMPRRNALEVYYVCVVLGFRGLYHLEERAFLAEQLKLPNDIASWARKVAKAVKLGQQRPRIQESSSPPRGAPPLTGKFHLVSTSLVGIVLAGFLVVLAFYLHAA